MQPENNAQENSEGSRLENAVKEVTAAEAKPAATEPSKKDNMFENTPKKSGKGMIFGLVLCAILAVGGIGFGVWAMMDGNTQKNSLNEQISALKAQNNELQEKLSTTTTTDTDTDSEALNATDYIYVGEWELKIKTPKADRFGEFSYAFALYDLYLWGAKTEEQPQATTAFGMLGDWNGQIVNNTFLGKVEKEDASFFTYCEAQNRCGTKIIELDDGSTLVWFDSESAASVYSDQQDYDGQLQESIDILKTHFTNPDNYSKI